MKKIPVGQSLVYALEDAKSNQIEDLIVGPLFCGYQGFPNWLGESSHCYLVIDNTKDCKTTMWIWCSSNIEEDRISRAKSSVEQIRNLEYGAAANSICPIETIKQGEEPEEFWIACDNAMSLNSKDSE